MTDKISDDETNDILLRLRQDFLDDVIDRLDRIEDALFPPGGKPGDPDAVLQLLRRECHGIKGMGSSFGFPIVTTIAHRLEDYLSGISVLTDSHAVAIDVYLRHLRTIVERGHDPAQDAAEKIIRSLPINNAGFDLADVELRDVEVLLVAPSRTIAHMVSRELAACGYRVTTARTPWEAFELCVCMRPDIVIASATLERVTGVDLLRMFAAISTTTHIMRAVLTSFSRDHHSLDGLPENTHIVRLKGDFAADLADVITDYEGQASPQAASR